MVAIAKAPWGKNHRPQWVFFGEWLLISKLLATAEDGYVTIETRRAWPPLRSQRRRPAVIRRRRPRRQQSRAASTAGKYEVVANLRLPPLPPNWEGPTAADDRDIDVISITSSEWNIF
jgi:hypothetical protein